MLFSNLIHSARFSSHIIDLKVKYEMFYMFRMYIYFVQLLILLCLITVPLYQKYTNYCSILLFIFHP